jgi:hypothetical protein
MAASAAAIGEGTGSDGSPSGAGNASEEPASAVEPASAGESASAGGGEAGEASGVSGARVGKGWSRAIIAGGLVGVAGDRSPTTSLEAAASGSP